MRGAGALLGGTMVLIFAPRAHPKDGLGDFQRTEGHYVLPHYLIKPPARERVESATTPRSAGSRLRRFASKLWPVHRG